MTEAFGLLTNRTKQINKMEKEKLVPSQIISASFYRTLYYNKDIYDDLTDTHLTPRSWRPTAQLQLSAGACAEEHAEERTQSSSLRKRSSTYTVTNKLSHEVKKTPHAHKFNRHQLHIQTSALKSCFFFIENYFSCITLVSEWASGWSEWDFTLCKTL